MNGANKCNGSPKYRLADWGRKQRSGSRGADHLLIHLTALCNKSHRCTLSDNGIAKYFGLKKRSVSRYLAVLRGKGLIASHFDGPGRAKRVIIFLVTWSDTPLRTSVAPNRPLNQRQAGGQNPMKIESGTGCAAPEGPRPVPDIPATATPWESWRAYRSFHEQDEQD